MKAPAFIRGFKRFKSRRGTPELIIHDNFKTFKAKDVKRFFHCIEVKQKFILPASPWWGGFYERLVRSVKLSLKKVLGKSLLTYEELSTVLCEIEAVINSRSLCYVNEDDLCENLTPNHLIFSRDMSSRNCKPNEKVLLVNPEHCSKAIKYLGNLLSHFEKPI